AVQIEANHFLNCGEELLRLGPIREVRLENARQVINTLAESSLLSHLTTLSISSGLVLEDLRALLNSPHLTSLTSLRLSGNRLGATGVEYLTDPRTRLSLRELNLDENRIGAAGLQALTAARHFCQGLTALSLSNNDISASGARALAALPETALFSLNLAY